MYLHLYHLFFDAQFCLQILNVNKNIVYSALSCVCRYSFKAARSTSKLYQCGRTATHKDREGREEDDCIVNVSFHAGN